MLTPLLTRCPPTTCMRCAGDDAQPPARIDPAMPSEGIRLLERRRIAYQLSELVRRALSVLVRSLKTRRSHNGYLRSTNARESLSTHNRQRDGFPTAHHQT
eukprot:1184421-Prorocentrum_minimum.AAC.3